MNTDRPTTDAARARTATTQELRDAFLIEELFVAGEARTAAHAEDRMLVAGVVPAAASSPRRARRARRRRPRRAASSASSTSGAGEVHRRRGSVMRSTTATACTRVVGSTLSFRGADARFYVVAVAGRRRGSRPCAIPFADTEPASHRRRGRAGRRALHKYVWGDGDVASSQLQFGVTVLEPGSVWNTFPPHLHERRTEIYLYFELDRRRACRAPPGRARPHPHLDRPRTSRPSSLPRWSIHTGAGTGRYSFVWAMAGDNRDYGDLAPVPVQRPAMTADRTLLARRTHAHS